MGLFASLHSLQHLTFRDRTLFDIWNETQDADLDAKGHVAPETLVHVDQLLVLQAADLRNGSAGVQVPEEALLIEILDAVHAAAFKLHRRTQTLAPRHDITERKYLRLTGSSHVP